MSKKINKSKLGTSHSEARHHSLLEYTYANDLPPRLIAFVFCFFHSTVRFVKIYQEPMLDK